MAPQIKNSWRDGGGPFPWIVYLNRKAFFESGQHDGDIDVSFQHHLPKVPNCRCQRTLLAYMLFGDTKFGSNSRNQVLASGSAHLDCRSWLCKQITKSVWITLEEEWQLRWTSQILLCILGKKPTGQGRKFQGKGLRANPTRSGYNRDLLSLFQCKTSWTLAILEQTCVAMYDQFVEDPNLLCRILAFM